MICRNIIHEGTKLGQKEVKYLNEIEEQVEYEFGGIKLITIDNDDDIDELGDSLMLAYAFNY